MPSYTLSEICSFATFEAGRRDDISLSVVSRGRSSTAPSRLRSDASLSSVGGRPPVLGPMLISWSRPSELKWFTMFETVPFVRPERRASSTREIGWRIEVPGTGAHVMTFHSKAYRHDNWPCEIDVHDRFPGFFADPQDVFEALWARRTTATIAGREVPCPDILGNAAIAALHALRDPSYERSRRDLAFMTEVLSEGLVATQLRELAELAVATGAADTMRPFLDGLGAPRLGVGTTPPEDLQAWRIRTS